MGHYGKGKTRETVKRPMTARVGNKMEGIKR
jgi:hypothetical protein